MAKAFDGELEEKLAVIDSNLTGRQLNTFQRIELALQKKPILEEIARQKQRLGGKEKLRQISDKPIRVDERIAKDANTSRDTVRKVETILAKSDDETIDTTIGNDFSDVEIRAKEIKDRLRAGSDKINKAYTHLKRNELRQRLSKAASIEEFGVILHERDSKKTPKIKQPELIPRPKTIFQQDACTKKDILSFLLPLEDTAVLTNVYFEVENK